MLFSICNTICFNIVCDLLLMQCMKQYMIDIFAI
jgi:hypothetical protein